MPNLLRLQAKQLTGQLSSSLKNGETRVKRVAAALPPFPGTTVSLSVVAVVVGRHIWSGLVTTCCVEVFGGRKLVLASTRELRTGST